MSVSNKIALICVILVFCCVSCKPGIRSQTTHDIEKTVSLEKPTSDQMPYTYVPFDVPPGTKSLSVGIIYEPNEGANRIDFGIFDNKFSGTHEDKNGFRGWSGNTRSAVFIAQSNATHGFQDGAITSGKWWVILGLASIEDAGVTVTLTVDFDKIADLPLAEFEEENNRRFASRQSKRKEDGEVAKNDRTRKSDDLNWLVGDLHSHTFHSDGQWSVKGILDSALSNNLDFVSITDHNTFTHHREIESLAAHYKNLLILNGQEVTTYGGHFNVWGLNKGDWVDFRVLPNHKESAARLITEATKLGALASINHPAMNCAGCRWTYGDWAPGSIVEIWNGVWDAEDESVLGRWDDQLVTGKKVVGIGSSDSHRHPDQPGEYPANLAIGEPSVFVAAKENSKDSVLDAIKRGRVFVAANSSSKFALEAYLPDEPEPRQNKAFIGDSIENDYGEVIEFRFSASGFEHGAKLHIIANGQVAREYLVYEDKLSDIYRIYVKDDGYVRLEVRGVNGIMLGFSNPIFFGVKVT